MSRFVLTAQLQLQAPSNVRQVVQQIQNQLNNVRVDVQVQGAQQAQRQLNQVTASTNDAANAATRLGKSFGLSIKRFAAFSIATRAVSLFTSSLSSAIKESIAFERELIKISQVTGKTLSQLRGLTSEITKLSTSLGVSSTSLLGVSRILSQAGLNADETRIALDALAKSELAPTFDDIQQTAEGVVAVFNQFQQGAAALEEQLGSINAVAGKFAVEAGDLISVVRRTGGVFKAAGGDLNELIALFTSVRATTRESAESIATGLRTIFTRIQRPETIQFLRQYGVELLDLEGKFVGPFEATKRLSEALAGLEQGDITFIKIAEELGGFRQIGKVIPLLQQFTVAQEALNVAQKGSGSLADDAAKAQLSLAVRITKVKEEFLALVRSITETTSFQLFANTALNLASALIKLADALKPIIPLLTAFAGIKLATGVGSFIRGIGGGLRTPRGFATGGLVPGSGNRDTVPAMLTPGEFVIKKSSVAKLGAGNLAAMNENRYAAGGIVSSNRSLYGPKPDFRVIQRQYSSLGLSERQARQVANGTKTIGYYERQKLGGRKKGEESKQGTVKQVTIGGPFGASFLRGYGTNVNLESRIYDVFRNGNKTGVNALKKAIIQSTKLPIEQALPKGAGITVKATQGTSTFLDPKGGKIFDDEIMNILPQAFDKAAKKFNGELSIQGPPKPLTSLLSKSAISSIEGQFFEAYVRGVTNNVIKDEGKKDAIFDFSSINQEQANKLFGIKKFVIPNEFKNDPNPANIASVLAKAAGQVGGIRVQKFATGGAVGTDTVPALLTPGEFVINRSSAQKIGYGSLNRMNKVGKYAKGGVVHKFASGTSGTGVPSGGAGVFSLGNIGAMFGTVFTKARDGLRTALESSVKLRDNLEKNNRDQLRAINEKEIKELQTLTKQRLAEAKKNRASQKEIAAIIDSAKKEFSSLKSGRMGIASGDAGSMAGALQAKASRGALTGGDVFAGSMAGLNKATLKAISSTNAQAIASQKAAAADKIEASASTTAAAADEREAQSSGSAMKGGTDVGMALTLGAATLQSFLPVVDENSSAMLKATHSLLGMLTAVGSVMFMLQAFGITVNGAAIASVANAAASFLMGNATAIATAGCTALAASASAAAASTSGFAAAMLTGTAAVISFITPFVAAAAPFIALAAIAVAVVEGFNYLIGGLYDKSEELKKAQEAGDIGKSEQLANQQYDLESGQSARRAGGYAGAAIGAFFGGPIGAAIGSAVGAGLGTLLNAYAPGLTEAINVFFGGDTRASAVAMAGANAAAAKAAKSLAAANDKTSKAMEEFRNGTASATDVLKASSQATKDALIARQKANKAIDENEKNKSVFGRGAVARDLGAYLTLGYVDTAADRNKKIDEENKALDEGAKKAEEDAIKAAMPGLQVLARETAATGGSFEDFQERIKATDPALAELLLRNGANEIKKTFENLAKEAEKTRKAFEAMNLGFQNVAAISGALSVNMANYLASQEAGYSQLDNTIRTLEASVTSAAQGISDEAFSGALANARAGLEKLGATDEQIKKFEENLTAINSVQKNYAKASEETKNRLVAEFQRGAGSGQSAEQKKNTFADVVADQLADAGIGEEVRNRISDAIKGAEISGDDLNKILEGDLSVLDKVMTELGEKTLSQVIGPLQELAKYEKELVNITKKRLDLENKVVAAQQNLIAAQMEAAEIIAKYGGPAFTPQMQTQGILAQANVQSDAAGVSRLRTGSAAELNQRSAETRAGLDRIAGVRQRAAAGDEAAQAQLSGESGVRLAEQEKRLQELAKSDYDTTKKLIQQKEKELQVIQEKNKAEKAAIDSLLAGDIDKWFEQQAAVGATAAIATGNRELMNAFGAKAVGMAAQDIKRQQDAGVQTLYGQQLAGPGGLTERGYAAGLGMRGVSSPQAMAQIAAGTTAEEEGIKSEIRALASTLPNYAATQLQVAQDSLETANIQYQAAEMQLQAAQENAAARGTEVAGMARGGVVYANRGIFVPRGTDTVPAMLTPGEFVVRRAAVQRGNNLQILQAMNRGQSGVSNSGGAVTMANGGRVRYLENGGEATGGGGVGFGLSAETVQSLTTALNNFNQTLSQNIDKLNNTNFNVKLDATNINVNLTGGSFLSNLNKQIQDEVMKTVGQEITNYRAVDGGKLQKDTRVV